MNFTNSTGELFEAQFTVPRTDDSSSRIVPDTAPTPTRYKITVETV